jgi:transcriptional regulator with XRE-family HTH domain
MGKQIKILELTSAISEVLKRLYRERGKALLEQNNSYYSEIGKNLGLERYTSTDHNVTCSKLFAICDFLEISLSDFFKLVEEENQKLQFDSSTKGKLVKEAYKSLGK